VHHNSETKRGAAAPLSMVGDTSVRDPSSKWRNIQRTKNPRRDDQEHIVRDTSSGTHSQGHIVRNTTSGTQSQGRIVLAASKTPQGKCPEIRLTEYISYKSFCAHSA
jgi:hypothetical protein